MKYFFLFTDTSDDYELAELDMKNKKSGLKQTSFIRGERIAPSLIQGPIEIDLDYPEDVIPEMFDTPLTIREDLVKDLKDFGINNIDCYDCILKDNENNMSYTNYKVCNIIGLVDVFDMGKSKLHADSPQGAYLFNEIVIDEERAKGYHLFRPYGRISAIMVSDELKKYLENRKELYPHLRFALPEDFA